MTADRAAIAAKMRALAAKTVANGCTEAEALAAAELLARLLAQYNMTLDEAELRASPFQRHAERQDDEVGRRLYKVGLAIGELTGARMWTSRVGEAPEVTFFGFAHEVDVARYLLAICRGAMLREQARILGGASRAWTGRQRARLLPFLDGMSDRLAERLRALKPPPATGTGLVVLHGALIDQALADLGMRFTDGAGVRSRHQDPAYLEGRDAAGAVALNRGLAGRGAIAGLLR